MRTTMTGQLKFNLGLGLTLVALALAACKGDAPVPPAAPAVPAATDTAAATAATTRAKAALKPLKEGLMGALKAALAAGPPADAITVCRDQAPAIAAAASRGGVTVGRTSAKLRNPNNAPRPWLAPLLAEYNGKRAGEAPPSRVVPLPDGGFGYVEPIFTAPLCAACHGATLDPAVETRLTALYPSDQARGYAEGDLRGLFWAEVAPTAP